MTRIIPVTKPFLPPLNEYNKLIEGVWERKRLTNNGPLVQQLETKLKEYCNVQHLLYTGSGTIALQMAIKALDLKGEIITTPFSYVATTSSIVWEGCKPVFVDIDPNTLNINPELIEEAITERTSAIIATHVFGNPCDVFSIEKIARKHKLKVIYDGAHAFGTSIGNKSILDFGDMSITSFHATKIFHTIEGGALITKDGKIAERLKYLRNFGHDGPGKFNGIGINGKNSEFHAAMGIVNIKYVTELIAKRRFQSEKYDALLMRLNVAKPKINSNAEHNYSYYAVIFETKSIALKMKGVLETQDIFPRRYFYPSLSSLDYVSGTTPISDDIASRILCLPLYHDLTEVQQELIASILLRHQSR